MLICRGDDTEVPEGEAEIFSTTQGKAAFTGSSDWKRLEVSLDPIPENIKSITTFMAFSAKSGSVYFDDLKVETPDAKKLLNGNFELGTLSPDYWEFKPGGDTNNVNSGWDTNVFLSFKHSIKLSSSSQSKNTAYWAQTFSAEDFVNSSIEVSVNIKAENVTGTGLILAIRGDTGDELGNTAEIFYTTETTRHIAGTFDWSIYSISSGNIRSDIKWLSIYLIYASSTSGSAYFDDVELKKK